MPTKIEWTDETWNPVRGCSRVSEGCRNCYAEGVAARFTGAGMPYEGLITKTTKGPTWNGEIKLVPEKLDQPLRWTRPRRIFVNSMSDLFHPAVPDEFVDKVFAVMALAKQHTFQILTKRPDRMLRYFTHHFTRSKCSRKASEFSGKRDSEGGGDISVSDGPFPLPNVWLGVSIEDQATADDRIPLLLKTPAAVRWISAEPLLGPVDLPGLFYYGTERTGGVVPLRDRGHTQLDWVVVGGESGPKARPMHSAWARGLRDQCVAAGVPFLFKQWGEWAPVDLDANGGFCDWMIVDVDGNDDIPDHRMPDDRLGEIAMRRAGKKSAGRLLDGTQHDGYPVMRYSNKEQI